MKKTLAIVFCLVAAIGVMAADSASAFERPSVAEPQICPTGSFIDIVPMDDKAKVVVKGVKLFNNQIEIYGGGVLTAVTLDANGEATIPARRRINAAFLGADGKYHYFLWDADDAYVGYPCLGKGVTIVPGSKGASLTAEAWVRR